MIYMKVYSKRHPERSEGSNDAKHHIIPQE